MNTVSDESMQSCAVEFETLHEDIACQDYDQTSLPDIILRDKHNSHCSQYLST